MATRKRTVKDRTIRTVNITADNIAKGKPSRSGGCPVALALKAEGFHAIGVGFSFGLFKLGKIQFSFGIPRKVENFIHRFDDGKSVKPFSFRLIANPKVSY